MRIEVTVRPEFDDGRVQSLSTRLADLVSAGMCVSIVDVYLVEDGVLEHIDACSLGDLFRDAVTQTAHIERSVLEPSGRGDSGAATRPGINNWSAAIEVAVKPGVTDPVAITAVKALEAAGASGRVQTARLYVFSYAQAPEPPSARAPRDAADSIGIAATAGAPAAPGPHATAPPGPEGAADRTDWNVVAARLHNPLIESATILTIDDFRAGSRLPDSYPVPGTSAVPTVRNIPILDLDDHALAAVSKDRLLALSRAEFRAVQAHFAREDVQEARAARGLTAEPTDVELEMIAQTWSEHCKHKIFAARFGYDDGSGKTVEIDGLFTTYIKGTTDELARGRDDLLSVFHDNSGVVAFDENYLVCFKVETHNSPSALDPYGGAITGIVGVNRDIIGTGLGAFPMFNTDVLCFGLPDTAAGDIPAGLMHPKEILRGVHRGIVDGGNQSGIPVIAGAFFFDESYRGKPLVFCGTGGILPRTLPPNGRSVFDAPAGADTTAAKSSGGPRPSWRKCALPGDFAVMVGGRIGKDGIHGATFSSQALDEASPVSAVQIGDPITQRRMLDFLMAARDRGLYTSITDNGAGGLSSSLGEMAHESGGVFVDLASCPLKYEGLAPWEIWVSESQERMSVAVPPDCLDDFLELAKRRDVEATAVGRFRDDGFVTLQYGEETVGLLYLEFLEKGLPRMEIPARWIPAADRGFAVEPGPSPAASANEPPRLEQLLLDVLSHPNVAGKDHLVRQYDHEVGGRTVVRPFCGRGADPNPAVADAPPRPSAGPAAGVSGPTDGGVVRPLYNSSRGLTVTHGLCPRYGDYDTYHMAAAAVDEAYRAHIALGGDPDRAYVLDNFCWPDPVLSDDTPDGPYKAAQLVRACQGLADACRAYGLPMISGKDSMKNDARLGDTKISVRPTLLVSLMGIIENVAASTTTAFPRAGLQLFLVGRNRGELGGSVFEAVTAAAEQASGAQDPQRSPTQRSSALAPRSPSPAVYFAEAKVCYRSLAGAIRDGIIAAVHDLSDGGLSVSLAEAVIGGEAGAYVDLAMLAVAPGFKAEAPDKKPTARPAAPTPPTPPELLFCESTSRFVVAVVPGDGDRFTKRFPAGLCTHIGSTTADRELRVSDGKRELIRLGADQLAAAYGSLEEQLS